MPQILLDFDAIQRAMDRRDWATPQLYAAMERLGYEGSERSVYLALRGQVRSPALSFVWYAAKALGISVDSLLTQSD
jgi:hypothetical protein